MCGPTVYYSFVLVINEAFTFSEVFFNSFTVNQILNGINVWTYEESSLQNISCLFSGMRTVYVMLTYNLFSGQNMYIRLKVASRNVKVIVVGNPCNTKYGQVFCLLSVLLIYAIIMFDLEYLLLALICLKYAPNLPAKNFHALTRLDENRANCQVLDVKS